jgi:hypothetical protein
LKRLLLYVKVCCCGIIARILTLGANPGAKVIYVKKVITNRFIAVAHRNPRADEHRATAAQLPLLAQVGVGTVTIQAGGTAPALAVDVDPVDNTINGPELLYAARILVWDA